MPCGFRVHWHDGALKSGLFDALVVEHTPGNAPAGCRLIERAGRSSTIALPNTLIELRQIQTITVEGLIRLFVQVNHPASLQPLTSAEDRVKAALDGLSPAEQMIAYRYLYHLGLRIAACSERDIRRALGRP